MSVEGLKRKVGEMGRVQGGRQRSPHLVEGPMTPYLRVANVFDGYIDTSDVLEMPFSAAEYERYELKPGDLLLNEGQSLELVGRCAKYEGLPKGCCFQNTLVRFQAGPECDTDYAYQLFRWCQYTGIFALIATKTNSIAHLGSTRFAELALPFPPLPEQRKIAAILSTWDDSLATLTNLLAAKRQQKRGLAEALLTGKKRLKGFEGEWEEKRIDDLFKEVTRFVDWDDSAIYRQAIVRRWSQGITTRDDLEGEKIKVKKLQKVKLNDFLISNIQAAYGAMAKVGDAEQGLFVSNLYTILEAREGLGDVDYFDQFSRLPQMEQLVIASSNGFKAERIRLNFDPKTFLKQKIFVPPTFSEQKAIAFVLSTLDAEIASLEALKAKVQEQKRGLMDELLTGRVRVRVQE